MGVGVGVSVGRGEGGTPCVRVPEEKRGADLSCLEVRREILHHLLDQGAGHTDL